MRKGDADGVMAKGGRDALLVGWCVSVWEVRGGRGGAWVGRGMGWGAVVAVVTRGGRERGGGGGGSSWCVSVFVRV